MKFREHRAYRLAVQLAAVLLACIGLRSTVYHARRAPAPDPQAAYNDWIEANERRFGSVRAVLPLVRTIGYMADVSSQQVLEDGEQQGPWYAAQYVLAPVVVANSTNEELVLTNFNDRASEKKIDPRRFTVLHDSGNGVMLLQRVKP